MNRLTHLFRTKKSHILSVYFTAGYPNLNDNLPILSALEKNGIDLAEIGIPFSDPMANGIAPGVHYLPNYRFPPFAMYQKDCQNAESMSDSIISLPNHLCLSLKDVDNVCRLIS